MKQFSKYLIINLFVIAAFSAIAITGCDSEDNSLAPYAGSPAMSNIIIEQNSFTPKVTWVGGYVTVFGVNRGNRAALDSSLVWLIQKSGNNITYPVKYGEVPEGAQDLTSQFGGTFAAQLIEDSTYTIWVLKEEIWNQVSGESGKILKTDSTRDTGFELKADTIMVSAFHHVQITKNLDNYINIENISTFGRLGTLEIIQTNTSNAPLLRWVITQSGVTDTLIAAIGISEGSQYSASGSVWELYSEEQSGGGLVYGKSNVISPPITPGDKPADTKTFVEFPAEGLQRNKGYYIWIANKDWDGVSRLRATSFYAYATFSTR